MLDHVTLSVGDYPASKRFYEQALAPLGYEPLMEFEGKAGGFGIGGKPRPHYHEHYHGAFVHDPDSSSTLVIQVAS